MTRHWSEPLVGLPWAVRGRAPDGVDCLGLARLALAEKGHSLPLYGGLVDAAEETSWRAPLWHTVEPEEVREFDILAFGRGGIEDHLGVVAAPGEMLHIERDGQSVIERYDEERFQKRLIGVYRPNGSRERISFPPLPYPSAHDVTLIGMSFVDPVHDRRTLVVPPGLTLDAMTELAFPGATDGQRRGLRVAVGRIVVPPERWAQVRPRPGSIVTMQPLPGFNWRAFLTVAVAVAALAAGQFYVAPALAAAGYSTTAASFGASLFTAAVTIGGTLAINALFPVRQPGTADRKDVYSIQGFKNEARLDEQYAFPFGKTRCAPDIIGRPWMVIGELNNDGWSDRMSIRTLFCHGIVDANSPITITDERLGDTRIDASDEEYFEDVSIERVVWNPGDPPLDLYDHQVVPADGMGVTLRREFGDAPKRVIRVAPRDSEAIETIFEFPSGLINFTEEGDPIEEEVSFKVEYRALGTSPWTTLENNLTITAKRSSRFWHSKKWTLPTRGDYEVAISALQEEEDPDTRSATFTTNWIALYGHRPEGPVNVKRSLLLTAIEIRANEQLQGILESYNCLESRSAKTWNGTTWAVAESSSPATAFRLACQGPQQVNPKTDAQLDLPSLQAWHDYCVSKGLKFDYRLASEMSLPELLNMIARHGRASVTWDGLKWGVAIDRPQTVVHAHVTASNSREFGKGRAVQAERFDDALRVVFNDSTNGYQRGEREVLRPGFVGTPVKIREVEMPGVTDPAQAWIEGRRLWHAAMARRKTYNALVSWDHLRLKRGQRARLNNVVLRREQDSAWVRQVQGQFVTLSAAMTMVVGKSYAIRWRHVPAEVDEAPGEAPFEEFTRAVVTQSGEHMTLQLTGTGQIPSVDDLVSFGESGAETFDCIVAGIQRADRCTAHVSFVDHAPEIETLTDIDAANVPPWDGRVGDISGNSDAAPTGFTSSMLFNITGGGALRGFGHFTWTPVVGTKYELQWREIGTTAATVIETSAGASSATTSSLAEASNYEGRVRVKNSSNWTAWMAIPDVILRAEDEVLELIDTDLIREV